MAKKQLGTQQPGPTGHFNTPLTTYVRVGPSEPPDLSDLVRIHLNNSMYRLVPSSFMEKDVQSRDVVYWGFSRIGLLSVYDDHVLLDSEEIYEKVKLVDGMLKPDRYFAQIDFHHPDSFKEFDRELWKIFKIAWRRAKPSRKVVILCEPLLYGGIHIFFLKLPLLVWFFAAVILLSGLLTLLREG
jgi:hypothetical protein